MDNLKVVENEIVPIYVKEGGEKLINARELHEVLGNKRQFTNWIKQRIEQYDFIENKEFIPFNKFVKADDKGYGNRRKRKEIKKVESIANENKSDIGEVKEQGFKIDNVCYKINIKEV